MTETEMLNEKLFKCALLLGTAMSSLRYIENLVQEIDAPLVSAMLKRIEKGTQKIFYSDNHTEDGIEIVDNPQDPKQYCQVSGIRLDKK